jgi:hypothetical protein
MILVMTEHPCLRVGRHIHHPGVVTLLENGHWELATTWEHYQFAPDGDYGTVQGAVAHDF